MLVRIAVAGVLVLGCGRHQDQALSDLLADPMASRSQPNADLISADDTSSSKGGLIFKKPRAAKVLRSFAPRSQTAMDLYRQLVTAAERSGWRLRRLSGGAIGSKPFPAGDATISITVNEYVSPTQVVIVLQPVSSP